MTWFQRAAEGLIKRRACRRRGMFERGVCPLGRMRLRSRVSRGAKHPLAAVFGMVVILLQLAGCGDPSPATPGGNPNYRIGVNIAPLNYYGTEVPFLNLFKLSAPWYTQCDSGRDALCKAGDFAQKDGSSWDTREQQKLDVDGNGYPRSLPDPSQSVPNNLNFTSVATLVPTGLNHTDPSGRFLVLYEGEGTLEYGRGASRNPELSRPGRDVLDVTTDGEQTWIQLAIRATDPKKNGNYLRNIRVLPVGGVCADDRTAFCGEGEQACASGARCLDVEQVYETQVFDPRFLKNLSRFAAIRFMGYQNTNDVLTESWAQRTPFDSATWVSARGEGGPIEIIPLLGNALKADVWVNMPARANDDYIRRFAGLVKSQLAAPQRVYVEYSNEAWNAAFAAGAWMQQRGEMRWSSAADTPFGKRMQWYGMRSAEICDIWKEVWGESAKRVRCVVGAQAANVWTATQALDCPLWAAEKGGRPCYAHHIDALAVAPYFGYYIGGPKNLRNLESWLAEPDGGLERLFGELLRGGDPNSAAGEGALKQARQQIEQSASAARRRGLQLVAYEGGQHLVGVGETLKNKAAADLFVEANRDPRMGSAYRWHLGDWQSAGGGLYMLWNSVSPYSVWGSWGLLEYREQPWSPKFHAVMNAIAETVGVGD